MGEASVDQLSPTLSANPWVQSPDRHQLDNPSFNEKHGKQGIWAAQLLLRYGFSPSLTELRDTRDTRLGAPISFINMGWGGLGK